MLPACVAEINTGDCNAMSACKCEPDINPQPIGDFPDTQGTLQCGGKLSCQLAICIKYQLLQDEHT